MIILKIAIPLVALLIGGWMTYDGARALQKGDYTTASSGPHAGQLGPWATVVSFIGINPRGTPMKTAHVVVGLLWLASAVLFIVKPPLGWIILVGCSVSCLWYLPIGTFLSLLELAMLFAPQIRSLR